MFHKKYLNTELNLFHPVHSPGCRISSNPWPVRPHPQPSNSIVHFLLLLFWVMIFQTDLIVDIFRLWAFNTINLSHDPPSPPLTTRLLIWNTRVIEFHVSRGVICIQRFQTMICSNIWHINIHHISVTKCPSKSQERNGWTCF